MPKIPNKSKRNERIENTKGQPETEIVNEVLIRSKLTELLMVQIQRVGGAGWGRETS